MVTLVIIFFVVLLVVFCVSGMFCYNKNHQLMTRGLSDKELIKEFEMQKVARESRSKDFDSLWYEALQDEIRKRRLVF